MKLYWYKLEKDKITEEEVEVKETAKLYKTLDGSCFPYRFCSTSKKRDEGRVLYCWREIFVFFAEKNLEKARDLFVEYQKQVVTRKEKQIQELEAEIEEAERQINRLEDMEV